MSDPGSSYEDLAWSGQYAENQRSQPGSGLFISLIERMGTSDHLALRIIGRTAAAPLVLRATLTEGRGEESNPQKD